MNKVVQITLSAAVVCNREAFGLSDDGKCRILALRGGGVHGSYEVGVLNSLVDVMPPEELEYDYVGGVSIGAVNASLFSLFEKGDERNAVRTMLSLWDGHEASEFFEFINNWLIEGFRQSSLADNAKLKDIIREILGNKPF